MEYWSALGPKFSAMDQYSMKNLVPRANFLRDQNFRDSPNSTIQIWRDISIPVTVDAISISARGFADTKTHN